jgi:NAD kinase
MDVNLKNLETALKDIDDGKYFIQTVRLIEVDINGLIYYALNDVANCSAIPNSTLITKVIINGKIVMPTPKCTGIIISTSYGSSSWILSSNGAVIVEDDYECLCLAYRESSLKPHNFIISENSTIKISSKRDMMLAVDGENIPVFAETPISVCLSGANINMLRTTNTYEGIIQKLNRLTKFQYDQVNF